MAQTGEGEAHPGLSMDAAPAMIRLTDAEGLGVWFNRSWLDYTGRRMEEEVGNGWTAGIHSDDLAQCLAVYAAHVGRRAPFRMEYRLRGADGLYRWVLDVGTPRQGSEEGYVALAVDITALKDTEAALRSMLERRERALADAQQVEAMAQLTGGIAHDFSNALTVVAGNLALIEQQARGEGRLATLARNAAHAAGRGGRLAGRLLALAGSAATSPQPVRLDSVMSDLAGAFDLVLGDGISLEAIVGPQTWSVRVDPVQLQLMLVNLARNAREAMPTGGTLRIEASNVVIAAEHGEDVAPGRYVLIRIIDTGEGMAPEILDRACEPFFTTKEPERSRGLGLAHAAGFLTRAGGALRLNSAVGQGTTVRLYLPASESEAMAVPAPADTILVAEDDEDVRTLAVGVIESLGFSVLAAANGTEAVALLQGDKPIRLLFTDIVMPGKNGIEVAREARALRPELPIIFTTGYASRRLVQETALDLPTHILRKPWLPEDLDREIRAALGRDVN